MTKYETITLCHFNDGIPLELLGIAILKEEGEPYYTDIYNHSKPFPEKLNDIIDLTRLHMNDIGELQDLIGELYVLPNRFVRKRKKLIRQISELKSKCWYHNANIRRIARGINIKKEPK